VPERAVVCSRAVYQERRDAFPAQERQRGITDRGEVEREEE